MSGSLRLAATGDGIPSLLRFTKGMSRRRLSCAGIGHNLSPGTKPAVSEGNVSLRPVTRGDPP